MNGFVAVHCGAGYHSSSLKTEYRKLCHKACLKAGEILKQTNSAADAVEAALIVLENSELTNAGFGSNLSWDGTVECDASMMNGQTLHFGACGAVSNVKNPISLAKHLCNKQCENLSLGRIPPCILVGSGAKTWAERLGLQIVPDSKMVSGKAFKSYKNHRRKLRRFSELNDVKFSPLDTVGAICVDINGIIVAGASSGGIALKHEGRVGQAASFASGVWAEMGSLDKSSIASCTSGCGEHLIRTQLARSVAESLRGQCPPISFANCLRDNFYESPFLWDIPEKLGGALSIYYKESECSGELLWGHTTSSMCIGYMSTVDSKPKCIISQLPQNLKTGTKPVISGVPFTFPKNPVTLPIQWEVKTD